MVLVGVVRDPSKIDEYEVSQGNCFSIALAKQRDLSLATADPDLAAVARAEGVELVRLPDSSGKRP